MKITCDVIKDLLPLYVDEVLSKDSNALVEEHLATCSDCTKYYENLKEDNDIAGMEVVKVEENLEAIEPLKKIKKRVRRTAIRLGIALGVCILIGVLVIGFCYARGGHVDSDDVEISNVRVENEEVHFDVKVINPGRIYVPIGTMSDTACDETPDGNNYYVRCRMDTILWFLASGTVMERTVSIPLEWMEGTSMREIYYGYGKDKVLVWSMDELESE
jgi:hypothetical protein